jgi:hypothetical protein
MTTIITKGNSKEVLLILTERQASEEEMRKIVSKVLAQNGNLHFNFNRLEQSLILDCKDRTYFRVNTNLEVGGVKIGERVSNLNEIHVGSLRSRSKVMLIDDYNKPIIQIRRK